MLTACFRKSTIFANMIDEHPDVRQETTSEAADRVGELSKTAILGGGGGGDGIDKNVTKKSGSFL